MLQPGNLTAPLRRLLTPAKLWQQGSAGGGCLPDGLHGGCGDKATTLSLLLRPVASSWRLAATTHGCFSSSADNVDFSPVSSPLQRAANTEEQQGRIELIIGPMFAGKSTELLRRVRTDRVAGLGVALVKSAKDDRYSASSVTTHDGDGLPCYAVHALGALPQLLGSDYEDVQVRAAQWAGVAAAGLRRPY